MNKTLEKLISPILRHPKASGLLGVIGLSLGYAMSPNSNITIGEEQLNRNLPGGGKVARTKDGKYVDDRKDENTYIIANTTPKQALAEVYIYNADNTVNEKESMAMGKRLSDFLQQNNYNRETSTEEERIALVTKFVEHISEENSPLWLWLSRLLMGGGVVLLGLGGAGFSYTIKSKDGEIIVKNAKAPEKVPEEDEEAPEDDEEAPEFMNEEEQTLFIEIKKQPYFENATKVKFLKNDRTRTDDTVKKVILYGEESSIIMVGPINNKGEIANGYLDDEKNESYDSISYSSGDRKIEGRRTLEDGKIVSNFLLSIKNNKNEVLFDMNHDNPVFIKTKGIRLKSDETCERTIESVLSFNPSEYPKNMSVAMYFKGEREESIKFNTDEENIISYSTDDDEIIDLSAHNLTRESLIAKVEENRTNKDDESHYTKEEVLAVLEKLTQTE